MKVAVIGPGAMGCFFAARLARGGVDTVLVDYKPERANRLAESGITVEDQDGVFTACPEVVTTMPENADLIIPMVKAYKTSSLDLSHDVPVLTVQSGIGNAEALCSKVGGARVLAGATTEGSVLLSEGRVRHAVVGSTEVGAWTSCPVGPVRGILERAGFDVRITDAPGQIVWEKQALTSGIEPLSALLGVPGVRLLELPEARQLMRDLVVEAVKVASTEGYRFEHSLVERTEELCAMDRDGVAPMLQDIRAGKRTEIDSLSGEILRRAQIAALPTPRTRVVWQLVKALEQR